MTASTRMLKTNPTPKPIQAHIAAFEPLLGYWLCHTPQSTHPTTGNMKQRKQKPPERRSSAGNNSRFVSGGGGGGGSGPEGPTCGFHPFSRSFCITSGQERGGCWGFRRASPAAGTSCRYTGWTRWRFLKISAVDASAVGAVVGDFNGVPVWSARTGRRKPVDFQMMRADHVLCK